MSKKAILSTLLVSSALLGTATITNAATSGLKDESKLVMIKKDGVKLYKNSKLKGETKVARGTIYKVNGSREFKHKKYYRVYQENAKGQLVYKGYILSKDTQELKVVSVAKKDRLVGLTKDHQPAWKNLSLTKKMKTYDGTKHSSNFEVKQAYKLGKKTYFSLYRGKEWMGYMDASAFKVLTAKKVEKQHYIVTKNIKTYNDIYFAAKGKLEKGQQVTVKRIYTFTTGREYGSVYSKEGKWLVYANMRALKVIDHSHEKAPERPTLPTKPALPVRPVLPTPSKPSVPKKDKEERPAPKPTVPEKLTPVVPERPKGPETNRPERPVTPEVTKPSKPKKPNLPKPETEDMKGFIQAAKSLATEDKDFQKNSDFQTAVNTLEKVYLENPTSKNEKVLVASKKVYQMMMDYLQEVYLKVLPWNNNLEMVDPLVVKDSIPKVTPKDETVDHVAGAGKNLTQEQFAEFILESAPKVSGYYTKESYDAFANALSKAKALMAQAKGEVVLSAKSVTQMKESAQSLVKTQQELTFNRRKMIDVLLDAKRECEKWVVEKNKLDAANITYLAEVRVQSYAAMKGLNTFAAKLGYSLEKEKDQFENHEHEVEFSSKEQVKQLLKATKENAQTLAQLLYDGENDYYKYISTVTWSREENKFISIDQAKEEERKEEERIKDLKEKFYNQRPNVDKQVDK